MRLILLFFLLFLGCLSAHARRVTGRVTDSRGEPVEYVNIGIEGTQTGGTSDAQGRFALSIPDSTASGTLLISHITYAPWRIPVAELPAGELVVELSERAFEIPQVVVTNGRPRYRRVGGGLRVPLPAGSTQMKTVYEPGQGWWSEIGTRLTMRDPLLIEQISFPIESSTDSLLIRVNLYQMEGDSLFTPLHRTPFYALILPGRAGKDRIYTIDTSEVPVVARAGEILVAFEKVDGPEKDVFTAMPLYFGSTWHRSSPNDRFRKESFSICIGFQVYGRILPE